MTDRNQRESPQTLSLIPDTKPCPEKAVVAMEVAVAAPGTQPAFLSGDLPLALCCWTSLRKSLCPTLAARRGRNVVVCQR